MSPSLSDEEVVLKVVVAITRMKIITYSAHALAITEF